MWDLKELEEIEAERLNRILEREEEEMYERASILYYMAVSALFGGVMTLFVLSVLGHLK